MLSIRILLHPKHFSQFIAIAHLIFFLCFQCNGGHGTKGGEEERGRRRKERERDITTDRERGKIEGVTYTERGEERVAYGERG